jgi:response regulator RpfG family c-di-GMP phosphodiesterase
MYVAKITNLMLSSLERHDPGLSRSAYVISDLATGTAQHMGLEPKEVSRIGMAALLYNVGKLAISDQLLRKTDLHSFERHEQRQDSIELGSQILEISPFLSDLAPAVRHQHERWDGLGDPDHLKGEEIPLAARIIAVTEAYNLMEGEYPYQTSPTSEEAIKELQRGAGAQFDPRVVQAFTTMLFGSQKEQPSPQLAARKS